MSLCLSPRYHVFHYRNKYFFLTLMSWMCHPGYHRSIERGERLILWRNCFQISCIEKPGFSILSINIQSVNAKYNDFQSFVSRMNIINPISAICLYECWLGDADNVTMFNLENYKMTFLPKSCCAHGDLIIYAHKQFECRVMTEVVVQASDWNCLCVKVSHREPQSKIYVLCNIYIYIYIY